MTRGTLQAPADLPADWRGALWVGLMSAAARRRERELVSHAMLLGAIGLSHEHRSNVAINYIGVLNYANYTPEILKMIQAHDVYAKLERKLGAPVSDPEVQARAERQAAKLRKRHAAARKRAKGR